MNKTNWSLKVCEQMNTKSHERFEKESDSKVVEIHTLKLHQTLELQPCLGTGPVYKQTMKENLEIT